MGLLLSDRYSILRDFVLLLEVNNEFVLTTDNFAVGSDFAAVHGDLLFLVSFNVCEEVFQGLQLNAQICNFIVLNY